MNPHGRCTCSLICKPCPACVAYKATTLGVHTTGVQPGPPAAPKVRPVVRPHPKALTQAEILVTIGVWITTHHRLPLARDWRRSSEQRPPLSTFSIYRHWDGMLAFYHACVAAGYGTRQMLREAKILSGQNLRIRPRGTNAYMVHHE